MASKTIEDQENDMVGPDDDPTNDNPIEDSDDYEPINFIYIGRCTLKGGKTGGQIITVELLNSCNSRDLPKAIGFVYTVKAKLDEHGRITNIRGPRSIDTDQRKFAIRKDWVAAWQAQDKALDVAARARKIEQDHKLNELRAHLQKLKHEYGKTDPIGKLALEVVVLAALRGV